MSTQDQALSSAVQEAIRSNLSGVVAGELSDFIEKSKKQAAELERVYSAKATLERTTADLQARLSAHGGLDVRESAVAEREKAAQARELELLKREAVLDAKVAQAELGGVKYSMEAFLRNAIIRETVVSDVTKPVEGYPGGNGMSGGPGYLMRSPDGRPDTTTTTRTSE